MSAPNSIVPHCPACKDPMVKRKSSRGPFWGCSNFPTCRATRDIPTGDKATPVTPTRTSQTAFSPTPPSTTPTPGDWKAEARAKLAKNGVPAPIIERQYEPIRKVSGSPEQEAIWAAMLNDSYHMIVKAFAGTGKTFSMIQGILRMPTDTRIRFVAFNKHIAVEAGGKLRASNIRNVDCGTYHSLGGRIVRNAFPNVQIDKYKLDSIVESYPLPPFMHADKWGPILTLIRRLTAYAKNYWVDWNALSFNEQMETIADRHNIEINDNFRRALEYVPRTLDESIRRGASSMDFDDMIWLPVVMDLPAPGALDMLIVDEYQDSNLLQQELALRVASRGRLVIVGDPYQSIYAFRGADTDAMPRAIQRLEGTDRGAKVFPLSITRRCPKKHVELAQALVPDIKAMDTAPEGEIYTLTQPEAIANLHPGDLVICRVNAELIPAAYALLRRGVKPVVRGKDIGDGLIDLVTKLEKKSKDIYALVTALDHYRHEQLEKLAALGQKGAPKVEALNDKCDCLLEMCSEVKTISELKDRIESLFADFTPEGQPNDAVVLGTVHRTKGLEAPRVFVLAPNLIPHPMAKTPREYEQEKNLAYIAVTRAKYDGDNPGTIVFCGVQPMIYCKPQTEEESATNDSR